MLRLADTDRERLIALLRQHCVEGRLTLDEFSDRVGAVYAARTEADLLPVLADLPAMPVPTRMAAAPAAPAAPGRARGRAARAVAVFGSATSRVRFHVDGEPAAIAVFGEAFLDLSAAVFDGPVLEVTAVACFGDVTVVVPEGAEVDVEGFSIFGDRSVRAGARGGGPAILVKAYGAFADVKVRTPSELGRRQKRLLR